MHNKIVESALKAQIIFILRDLNVYALVLEIECEMEKQKIGRVFANIEMSGVKCKK